MSDPERGSSRLRHAVMREQALAAVAICAGVGTVDPDLFGAMQHRSLPAVTEPGGGMTAYNDAHYAFGAAFYAPSYGPLSARQRFRQGHSVAQSLQMWGDTVAGGYAQASAPARFRQLFFEGGLWRVFLPGYLPPASPYLARMALPKFDGLKRDSRLLAVAEETRQRYFVRDENLPHRSSHIDAARFVNTVLSIGENELGLSSDDDKEALLTNSMPELYRLAILHVSEMNKASDFMHDPTNDGIGRKYTTIDADRLHVGLNIAVIQERINKLLPDASTYIRRRCPVVFLKTPYGRKGEEETIFNVMNATLVRLYLHTGAVAVPAMRRLPFNGRGMMRA